MADRTTIEWTRSDDGQPGSTWNPIRGCTRVSEGCRNCYAEVMAARFSDPGQWGHGLAQRVALPGGGTDHRWTGKVELVDTALDLPLRWRRPRRIFVNSTSDLFHENVPDEWIDKVFAVMALAPQHRFQVLTKRPERMQAYFAGRRANFGRASEVLHEMPHPCSEDDHDWAVDQLDGFDATGRLMHQVWLGTSIENQAAAEERVPYLLETPAAVRFVSAEPLLGPVRLDRRMMVDDETYWDALCGQRGATVQHLYIPPEKTARLDWVICGGESGPGARPMHPDWARSLRDQCQAAGVPFFFKQWGEWAPDTGPLSTSRDPIMEGKAPCAIWNGQGWDHYRDCYEPPERTQCREWMYRLGKKRAGRLLDGREWNEVPNIDSMERRG